MLTLLAVKLESNSNENFRFLTPKPVQKILTIEFSEQNIGDCKEKKTEVNGEVT